MVFIPRGWVVKNSPASAGGTKETGLLPTLGRPPGGGNGNPLQYLCLENPMDRGIWQAAVHGVAKSWTRLRNWARSKHGLIYLEVHTPLVAQLVKNPPAMQETLVRFLGGEVPLEKGMATHSSILAWRIPWTEEPSQLQSMGSQIVRHDWVTKHTHTYQPNKPRLVTTLVFKLFFPTEKGLFKETYEYRKDRYSYDSYSQG